MSYPQIVDYNEAVQEANKAFVDPQLRSGRVETSPLGLPIARSGGFALTYSVSSGPKRFAVRCFHRQVPEVQQKYAAISSCLRALNNPYFVEFDFQQKGILIRGAHYPIVKMDWVDGDTLGQYLDKVATNAKAVIDLRAKFFELAQYLEAQGIAHGDIQNENIILAGQQLRLIDYDGMFVPGLSLGKGSEVGHKHFQHPGRRIRDYGPKMDRFSSIVIDVSLEALSHSPKLHVKYKEGGQAIIFKANDFMSPADSDVFSELKSIPATRRGIEKLEAICSSSISDVPSLADFVADRGIPTPSISATRQKSAEVVAKYIGAFDVLDATDFAAVLNRVGDKVELVGKVVSVKRGISRRKSPYVFVNFGDWQNNSVKLTIWSEGLKALSEEPDESWVGRWLSVTGLVEPPYDGNARGRRYRSVGVTIDSGSQILRITQKEAKYRLGGPGSSTNKSKKSAGKTNQEVLSSITGKASPARRPPGRKPANTATAKAGSTPSVRGGGVRTQNQAILDQLQPTASRQRSASPQYKAQQTQYPTPKKSSGGIPGWVWILGVVLLIIALASGS